MLQSHLVFYHNMVHWTFSDTQQDIFPYFYIINLPSIIAIQLLHGVGGGNGLILYIIDRLCKAG